MLKKRIVATLVVKDGIVVQSIGFKKYLPVGKPEIAIEFLNQWGVDEIIFLDISATKDNRGPDFHSIKNASLKCHVPLTIGGGISSLNQMKELMHCGADKISLNHIALTNKDLIFKAAQVFGKQCIVISIDVIKSDGTFKIFNYLNNQIVDISLEEYVLEVQNLGAGEILINSVDRDGSYLGYDHDLINSICKIATVPVICSGGAKNASDFIEVFDKTNVSAASASNMFHFTEHSVIITKAIIKRTMDIRLDTFADYSDSLFDNNIRLNKKSDKYLEDMLFIKIEKEII